MTPRRDVASATTDDSATRLSRARRKLEAAHLLFDADPQRHAQSIGEFAIHAAIMLGDALCIAKLRLKNRENHSRLPRLVSQAAGAETDPSQIARLQRILQRKNDADYEAENWNADDAAGILKDVDRFGRWIASFFE